MCLALEYIFPDSQFLPSEKKLKLYLWPMASGPVLSSIYCRVYIHKTKISNDRRPATNENSLPIDPPQLIIIWDTALQTPARHYKRVRVLTLYMLLHYCSIIVNFLPSILYIGERSQWTDRNSFSTDSKSSVNSACTVFIRSSSRFASSTSCCKCVLSPFMFSSCFDALDSLMARCSCTRSFSTTTSFCKSST